MLTPCAVVLIAVWQFEEMVMGGDVSLDFKANVMVEEWAYPSSIGPALHF